MDRQWIFMLPWVEEVGGLLNRNRIIGSSGRFGLDVNVNAYHVVRMKHVSQQYLLVMRLMQVRFFV